MLHTHFQRIIIYVLVSVLIFAVYTPAHANSVQLEIQGIDEKTENGSGRRLTRPIIKTFRENHPAARIVFSSQRAYKSSEQLVQALNTGKLKSDIFTLTSRMSNFHSVFGSGICMDISENKRLSESLASMFSTIGATGKLENKIYGIPIELSTLPHLYYRQEAWNAAGYSLEEIPTSYAKLLDFLEKWIERIKTHPSENICVMNAFDIENVTKGVYTDWLLKILLQSYIIQCEILDEDLQFDDPTLIELIEQTKAIGEQLYQYENKEAKINLFEVLADVPQSLPRIVYTRLTENDPLFVGATVTVACINSKSENKEVAQEFLESYIDWVQNHSTEEYGLCEEFKSEKFTYDDYYAEINKALLFQEISGPIHSQNLHAIANVPVAIEHFEKILQGNLSEKRRALAQASYEHVSSEEYYTEQYRKSFDFTEAELKCYQEMTPYLFFPSCVHFDIQSKETSKVIIQYIDNKISTNELVQRLNEQVK